MTDNAPFFTPQLRFHPTPCRCQIGAPLYSFFFFIPPFENALGKKKKKKKMI
jgi:hypothetical protein